jgi:glycerol kinase
MASSPRYIAALDQGTTSTRCILFNQQGDVVAVGQREHTQHYPEPGWVEHNALEIWRNTHAVIVEALARATVTARDVAALGITNQRETTVLWNRRTGVPVHHALVWQDTRVEPLVQEYARRTRVGGDVAGAGEVDGDADRIRALTGLPLASYFSALKLQWLLDNVAGARESATSCSSARWIAG